MLPSEWSTYTRLAHTQINVHSRFKTNAPQAHSGAECLTQRPKDPKVLTFEPVEHSLDAVVHQRSAECTFTATSTTIVTTSFPIIFGSSGLERSGREIYLFSCQQE